MLYHRRFSGHLDPRDPRTIVSGAGGCRWPTIPPWRIQFSSRDARGEFLFLRSRPIILEQDALASHHDYVLWTPIEKPREVYHVILEKMYTPAMHPRIQYFLTILLNAWDNPRVWLQLGTQRCNQNITWGDRYRTVEMGSTGDDFRQYQVEFNKWRSPGFTPP